MTAKCNMWPWIEFQVKKPTFSFVVKDTPKTTGKI